MGKGISNQQQKILTVLETNPMGEVGMCTAWIAFIAFRDVKPTHEAVKGVVEDPDPEKVARHHSRMQSIRRALRSLHERDLVVKLYSDTDGREYFWMARSVYDSQNAT